MSTSAFIGIVNKNGSVESIYTHMDGYPEHHGPILLKHYKTEVKARSLLKLGDLSQLASTLKGCNPHNREGSAAKTDSSVKVLLSDAPEWVYLLKNGRWLVYENSGKGKALTTVMKAFPNAKVRKRSSEPVEDDDQPVIMPVAPKKKVGFFEHMANYFRT